MFNWHLTTKKDQHIYLSPVQVIQMLMGKMSGTEKPDVDSLAMTFAEYLEANGALRELRLVDAIQLGANLGYYYKVFLTKNTVEVEKVGEADGSTHSSSNDSSSEGSNNIPS